MGTGSRAFGLNHECVRFRTNVIHSFSVWNEQNDGCIERKQLKLETFIHYTKVRRSNTQ